MRQRLGTRYGDLTAIGKMQIEWPERLKPVNLPQLLNRHNDPLWQATPEPSRLAGFVPSAYNAGARRLGWLVPVLSITRYAACWDCPFAPARRVQRRPVIYARLARLEGTTDSW